MLPWITSDTLIDSFNQWNLRWHPSVYVRFYYYALKRILSSKGAFVSIFLSVKTSLTSPSSSDLLVTADEEHSIQRCWLSLLPDSDWISSKTANKTVHGVYLRFIIRSDKRRSKTKFNSSNSRAGHTTHKINQTLDAKPAWTRLNRNLDMQLILDNFLLSFWRIFFQHHILLWEM